MRDGLLALDEPLPGKPYTLRHLLQHRSGLTNYGGFRAYHEAVDRGDDPWPVPELLDRLDADRLRYPAGEGWDYSNIGYLFVARLIEATADAELGEALQRLVLKPLGIEGARVARTRADLETVTMGSAEGYHPGWVYHGLLVGPVEDAALLLDRLLGGDLLPPDLKQEMLTPFVLPGPVPERPWADSGLRARRHDGRDDRRCQGRGTYGRRAGEHHRRLSGYENGKRAHGRLLQDR